MICLLLLKVVMNFRMSCLNFLGLMDLNLLRSSSRIELQLWIDFLILQMIISCRLFKRIAKKF
ncbi:activating signal cointegrator 1 complex subunit 3 [Rhinolophus ferrumequinum]|uniref:Activating signal cointegrator 1 complex subunit 3 n=1 Tax=Rhinolophus ferrumequinum TaxID=59479 RepID=A0A7J7YQ48_RHIFE|nr:activating signal cointegrator 1 complex subunit 3 [Rhinolophus ferrumequinum]